MHCKLSVALLFIAVLLRLLPAGAQASQVGTVTPEINRINLIFVMDASNSMNYTDRDGLRYQAIERFVGRMAEKGNNMGGVVFSNHIIDIDGLDLQPVNNSLEKKEMIDRLGSWMSQGVNADEGYTNIGEALSAAVDILADGSNFDLPTYIVFLSDGNTEMPSAEELEESLKFKTEAVNKAVERQIPDLQYLLERKWQSRYRGNEGIFPADRWRVSGGCGRCGSLRGLRRL